jgi:predicted hotdog family 3-hydroxylacyl-ACP dehydratase
VIQGERLASMLPHAGAMVLLDGIEAWGADWIACRSRSHLDPANPLRRDGALATVCGVEYALQAAALHGALRAGGVAQAAGYVARLHGVRLLARRLDDPAHGLLRIEARLERAEAGGMLYALAVRDARAAALVEARAAIALPDRRG